MSLLPPITYIDIVNYLLWTPSVYTKDELKSYKGLEAYNQFINGWVRERTSVVCNEYTVVTAKVCKFHTLFHTMFSSHMPPVHKAIIL